MLEYPSNNVAEGLQLYLKETSTQVFPYKYCEIFKNSFFIEHFRRLLLNIRIYLSSPYIAVFSSCIELYSSMIHAIIYTDYKLFFVNVKFTFFVTYLFNNFKILVFQYTKHLPYYFQHR